VTTTLKNVVPFPVRIAPPGGKRRRRGNGEGTIEKDDRGRWVGRISVRGKRTKFVGESKADVLARMAAFRSTHAILAKGQFLEKVGDVLRAWLHGLRLEGARESTIERCYGAKVRLHLLPLLGDVPVSRLDSHRVLTAFRDSRRFEHSGRKGDAARRTDKPLSPRSIQLLWVALNAALNWAVREGKIPVNPLRGKRGPRVEGHLSEKVQAWTPEQVQTFLLSTSEHASSRGPRESPHALRALHALWTLLLTSGLRISEALGLQWGDVDLVTGTVHVRAQLIWTRGKATLGPPKTARSRRSIPLAAQAIAALQGLQTARDNSVEWVFATSNGTPFSSRNVSCAWEKAIARAAVPRIRLHDARHTVVSLLLASGQDRYSVARHAGHSVTMMEGRYTHVLPKQAQAVAETMTRLLSGAADENERVTPNGDSLCDRCEHPLEVHLADDPSECTLCGGDCE
jgi:integrase